MKRIEKIFIVCCLILMVLPLAGMTFFKTTETKEKSELAPWPSLIEEGSLNVNILSDMGGYFNDHFAFKEPLITLNSLLLSTTLNSSNQPKVILGNDNLFFLGEMIDYQGLNEYSSRDLFNITSNLRLIQSYVLSKGSKFAICIVPNKSELYAQDVPSRYLRAEVSSLEKMEQALQQAGVNVISLYDTLDAMEDPYFSLDTHWDNDGALAAYQKLMAEMGIQSQDYSLLTPDESEHEGDLSSMLFPSLDLTDTQNDYSRYFSFSLDDSNGWVASSNENGNGTLLFYSDSFGEALFPYFANQYRIAERHTLVPMNLIRLEQLRPTEVIIERAQRRMNYFQESAPIMVMPQLPLIPYQIRESQNSTLSIRKDGGFYYISGLADEEAFRDDTELFVMVSDESGSEKLFPVFYIGNNLYDDDGQINPELQDENAYRVRNHGYGLYLNQALFKGNETFSLLMKNKNEEAVLLTSQSLNEQN